MKTLTHMILACALAVLLAGCGDSDVQEVRNWMKQVDSQSRPHVTPIAEPKTFVPFAYNEREQTDPFNPQKLLAELAKQVPSGSGIHPDTTRRKEVLEAFPLDTIRMVGTISKNGVTHAVLQVDRAVYQVTVGQHLGENYGRITAITDNAVDIKEIVQDATGDWVERMSKLELQESKENSK